MLRTSRCVASVLFSVLILFSACVRRTPTSTFKESHNQGDNRIRWIPNYVYDEQGHHDLEREQRIKANLKFPSLISLYEQGLFNQYLWNAKPEEKPWSAGFFPAWTQGVAGRWRDNVFSAVLGYSVLEEKDIVKDLILASMGDTDTKQDIYEMSPMEKYDLAVGDYDFKATRNELKLRGRTRLILAFWVGYCNGVSAAAIQHREPFRKVWVVNPDGYKVAVHPYDIKGLLGVSYYYVNNAEYAILGSRCDKKSLPTDGEGRVSTERCRGVNPATYILALQNRLGIARKSFAIDQKQNDAVSNHPVGEGRVTILPRTGRPTSSGIELERRLYQLGAYPFSMKSYGYHASPGTKYLVDVKVETWLGSTTLDPDESDIPSWKQGGVYKKIGFVPEKDASPIIHYATLELDVFGQIIGGEWGVRNSQGDQVKTSKAPDFAWFGHRPKLIDRKRMIDTLPIRDKKELDEAKEKNKKVRCEEGDRCEWAIVNPYVHWPVVEAIWKKSRLSEAEHPEVPVLDLVKEGLVPQRRGNDFTMRYASRGSQIESNLHFSLKRISDGKIRLYGYVSGIDRKNPNLWKADLVRLYGYTGREKVDPDAMYRFKNKLSRLDNYEIWRSNKDTRLGRYHFRLKSSKFKSKFRSVVLFFYQFLNPEGSKDDPKNRFLSAVYTVPVASLK